MKSWIFALMILITPSAVFADGEAPPQFQDLAEFLEWADKKLVADDYDGLVAAQTDTNDSRQTKIAYVKALDADLGEKKLTEIFEGREFSEDATTFKLGGHDKELGHCHIDFVKNGGLWLIVKIWQCR
jgi:hypothetical protein